MTLYQFSAAGGGRGGPGALVSSREEPAVFPAVLQRTCETPSLCCIKTQFSFPIRRILDVFILFLFVLLGRTMTAKGCEWRFDNQSISSVDWKMKHIWNRACCVVMPSFPSRHFFPCVSLDLKLSSQNFKSFFLSDVSLQTRLVSSGSVLLAQSFGAIAEETVREFWGSFTQAAKMFL